MTTVWSSWSIAGNLTSVSVTKWTTCTEDNPWSDLTPNRKVTHLKYLVSGAVKVWGFLCISRMCEMSLHIWIFSPADWGFVRASANLNSLYLHFFFFFLITVIEWVWVEFEEIFKIISFIKQELPRNDFSFPSIWRGGNQAETLGLWTCSWRSFSPPATHQHEFKVWYFLMGFMVPVPLSLPLGCCGIKTDPFLLFCDLTCIHVNFQCLSNSWQWVPPFIKGLGKRCCFCCSEPDVCYLHMSVDWADFCFHCYGEGWGCLGLSWANGGLSSWLPQLGSWRPSRKGVGPCNPKSSSVVGEGGGKAVTP